MKNKEERATVAAPGVIQALGNRFGWLSGILGSATVIGTVLLFAGFMSDFGAYRLADLPRLGMSPTILIEQGASVFIDSLSLLSGGLRAWVVAALLLGVIGLWGWSQHPRLQPWAQSKPFYLAVCFTTLVIALWLLVGLVDRVQRSLDSSQFSPETVAEALAQAYRSETFPDPQQRALALERQSYELRGNWVTPLSRLDVWWEKQRAGAEQYDADRSVVTGVPLRRLPEARSAARHVYGWLALSVVGVLVLLVLLQLWGRELFPEWRLAESEQEVEKNAATLAGDQPALPPEVMGEVQADCQTAPPRLLTALEKFTRRLGADFSSPFHRLVMPLCAGAIALSAFLLPLAHGLLARESLGGETVMVFLKKSEKKEKSADGKVLDLV